MQIFHHAIVQLKFLTGVIHSKVRMFLKKSTSVTTILNIFHNYIPNKTNLCNDKDPLWFNNEIKKILTKKNEIFKQYIANGKPQTHHERLQLVSSSLTETVRSSKEKFYYKLSTKLSNPSTSSKTYWSILKTFVNGKKVPITPLLLVNDKLFRKSLLIQHIFQQTMSASTK